MRNTAYDKESVVRDIADQKLNPTEIAEKHGITVANVYTIKAGAKRDGLINSRGYRTIDERIKDEKSVLDTGLRERIKDMREMDLTSSEIADLLQKEGIKVERDDVIKVMARGANTYALNRPSTHPSSGKLGG